MSGRNRSTRKGRWRALLRKLCSRGQFKYHLLFSPRYWRLRHSAQSFLFSLQRGYFRSREWLRSWRTSFAIFVDILKAILWQIAAALLLVAGLECVEKLVLVALDSLGHLAPAWGTTFARVAATLGPCDSPTFVTLRATAAEISAVFLGLYFTTVSVVASTMHGKVPGELLDLIVRDKVGNSYFRVVALLGAVSLLQLGGSALGISFGTLNLIFLVSLGVIAALSIAVLGTRALIFFDPAVLTVQLGRDLSRCLRTAGTRGLGWHSPSFQAHYQKEAQKALGTYGKLVELLGRDERSDNKVLMRLAVQACVLLDEYACVKHRIPSDSMWFKRKPVHRTWLTAGYERTKLAMRTGTTLQPDIVPDHLWFESQIGGILASCMKALICRNDYDNASSLADVVTRALRILVKHFAVEEALHILHAVGSIVSSHVKKNVVAAEGSDENREELRSVLALVDVFWVSPIALMVDFAGSACSISPSSVAGLAGSIRSNRPKSLYTARLPRAAIDKLEYLARSIRFERAVEGRPVSAPWYIQQTIASGVAEFISSATNALLTEIEHLGGPGTDSQPCTWGSIITAQLSVRGLEAAERAKFHLEKVKACFVQLRSMDRSGVIDWPSLDWEDLDRRINGVRKKMLANLARILPDIASVGGSRELPDYLGHCFSVLAQESFGSMASGDEELFQSIFPSLFRLCSSSLDRLVANIQVSDPKSRFVVLTDPLVDILELSGYAKVFSELDGKRYWVTVKELWDAYLSSVADAGAYIQAMGILNTRKAVRRLSPRGLNRTEWKQEFERQLARRGLSKGSGTGSFLGLDVCEVQHASPIVRTVAGGWHVLLDLADVFAVVYLWKRPEAAGLQLSKHARSFAKELQQELADDATGEQDMP